MIETERLIARKLTMDDVDPWMEFIQGEKSLEFMPFIEASEEGCKSMIERQLERYELDGFGLMALIHKETGEMIGQCGLLKQDVDGTYEIEVGYHLMPRFRGMGYATEAARAFKTYAFEHGIADSVVSLIHIDNVNSQNVALKNGMKREQQTVFYDVPVYVYRVSR